MGENWEDDFYTNKQSIMGEVITLILGILLVVIPYEVLKEILFTLVGIGIIVMNLIPCILSWMRVEKKPSDLPVALAYTLSIIVGILFIFWHHWIVSILLGIWLVVLPIIRIAKTQPPFSRKEQFKKELPFFVIAILLFLLPVETILAITLKILGGIMIGLSILYILYISIKNSKNKKKDKGNENSSENKDRVIIDAKIKDLD